MLDKNKILKVLEKVVLVYSRELETYDIIGAFASMIISMVCETGFDIDSQKQIAKDVAEFINKHVAEHISETINATNHK